MKSYQLSAEELQALQNLPSDGVTVTNWLNTNLKTGQIFLNKEEIKNFSGIIVDTQIRKNEANEEYGIAARVDLVVTFQYVPKGKKESELCRMSVSAESLASFKTWVNVIAAKNRGVSFRLYKPKDATYFVFWIMDLKQAQPAPQLLAWDKENKCYVGEPQGVGVFLANGDPVIKEGRPLIDFSERSNFWKNLCIENVLRPYKENATVYENAFDLCLKGEKWFITKDEQHEANDTPPELPEGFVLEGATDSNGLPF